MIEERKRRKSTERERGMTSDRSGMEDMEEERARG